MTLSIIASLPSNSPSESITNVLGIVAVCAFFGIALFIGAQVLRDMHRKSSITVSHEPLRPHSAPAAAAAPVENASVVSAEKEAERRKAFLEAVREKGGELMASVARVAEETFGKIAESYASNSFGHEGETYEVRMKKFHQVCERQWGGVRGDIGYVSYLDIQDHLRHILQNHRMLGEQKSKDSEVIDLSPELLRAQELISLMRVVPADKVRSLQSDLIEAVVSYGNYYQETCRKDLVKILSMVLEEQRPKKKHGPGSKLDPDWAKQLKQFKTRLDVVTQLSESVAENIQRVNEFSLALSQVIHVGTMLRVLASIPEWFEEFDLQAEDADDEE